MDELIKRLRSQDVVNATPGEIDDMTDEAADAIEAANARIAELERQLKDAAMSTHRQAICIQQCAAAIGPETSATINGLPNAVKALAEHNAALESQIAAAEKQEPVAPTFEARQVSLKQRGPNIILTLELNGIEPAARYAVTPINPAVVRSAAPLPSDGLRKDAERLDWLDAQNLPLQMGWRVGVAPKGNVSVGSVIQLGGKATSIRDAIDTARAKQQDQS